MLQITSVPSPKGLNITPLNLFLYKIALTPTCLWTGATQVFQAKTNTVSWTFDGRKVY